MSPRKSPKVLIIIDTTIIGGPGKGIFQFLTHVSKENFDYCIVNFSYPKPKSSQFNEYAERHGFKLQKLKERFRFDPSSFAACRNIAKEGNFTIVQSHGYKSHILAAYVSKKCGIPWIAFSHGWTTENWKVKLYHSIDKILLRFPQIAVAVSKPMLEILEKLRGQKRSVIVPNAVDPDEIRGDVGGNVIRSRYTISPNTFVVGTFGRLSHEKGQRILVEAFSNFLKNYPDSALIFTGEGPDKPLLELKIQRLGLAGKIHLAGHQEFLRDYYEAIDLLVIPSISENLPNVLLEAITLGKPVLSTKVGAVPDIIEDGKTGWLVTPGDGKELAEAMVKIAREPGIRMEIGKRARETILSRFDPKVRASAILQLYKDLLNF